MLQYPFENFAHDPEMDVTEIVFPFERVPTMGYPNCSFITIGHRTKIPVPGPERMFSEEVVTLYVVEVAGLVGVTGVTGVTGFEEPEHPSYCHNA